MVLLCRGSCVNHLTDFYVLLSGIIEVQFLLVQPFNKQGITFNFCSASVLLNAFFKPLTVVILKAAIIVLSFHALADPGKSIWVPV